MNNPRLQNAIALFNDFVEATKNLPDDELQILRLKINEDISKNDVTSDLFLKNKKNQPKNKLNSLDDFNFEIIMNKLRNAIFHEFKEDDDIIEVEWLLKIMLLSDKLFDSTREVNNFLSNITGFVHDTKSTGRDRIVEWYFKELKGLEISQQNRILYKIAKYLFINIPSNYKEWKKVLYKGGKGRGLSPLK